MKRVLLSAFGMIAILVASFATQAADLAPAPVRAPVKAAPVEVVNWTGLYIGGNFGYSWGRANSDFTLTPTGSTTTTTSNNKQDIRGVLGGAQIGYNWQNSAFLYGLEADFQGADQKGRTIAIDTNATDVANAGGAPGCTIGGVVGGTPCPSAITSRLGQKLEWFGTVRGRVGYLVAPSWLVYGTGGLAYGRVKSDFLSVEPDGETDVSHWAETRVGWSAGAGIEAMLWDRWTWRLEYLHVDLTRNGSTSSAIFHSGFNTPPPGIVVGNLAINTRASDEIVRVGLNYIFRP